MASSFCSASKRVERVSDRVASMIMLHFRYNYLLLLNANDRSFANCFFISFILSPLVHFVAIFDWIDRNRVLESTEMTHKFVGWECDKRCPETSGSRSLNVQICIKFTTCENWFIFRFVRMRARPAVWSQLCRELSEFGGIDISMHCGRSTTWFISHSTTVSFERCMPSIHWYLAAWFYDPSHLFGWSIRLIARTASSVASTCCCGTSHSNTQYCTSVAHLLFAVCTHFIVSN